MLSTAVRALAGAGRRATAFAAAERSSSQVSRAYSTRTLLTKLEDIRHAKIKVASNGKVLSSLVVERLPIVTPELEQWEKDYMLWQQSLRSKYKTLPEEFTEIEKPVADDGEAEEDPWQPASRITPADESGDVRNKQLGEWEFPTTEHQDGETIRGTAERNFKEALGDAKCYFVGNAPMAHFKRSTGATQFFNKVQIMQPSVTLQPGSGADDHIWVTTEEVSEYVKDEGLRMLSKRMLSK